MLPKPPYFVDSSVAGQDENAIEALRPSKTSQKKVMHALQELGEELVALSAERLRKVPLPEGLYDAVRQAQGMGRNEARRRQLQFIGKLMRTVDPEPIRAQLDIFNGLAASETARMHRLERLRTDLLEDEKHLTRIVDTWPHVDIQHLRTLRRNALKEQAQGKPPKAFREIFQILRTLDEDAGQKEPLNDRDDREA